MGEPGGVGHPDGDPLVAVGCPGLGALDVLIDATPANTDVQLRNKVYAARTGGTAQLAQSPGSIARLGEYTYVRTDLGLWNNTEAALWAAKVVELYAFPQVGLADVTMLPGILGEESAALWATLLAWQLYTDVAEVIWAPPDLGAEHTIQGLVRVVGYSHRVTRRSWEHTWQVVAARPWLYTALAFTMGPSGRDTLDSGHILV